MVGKRPGQPYGLVVCGKPHVIAQITCILALYVFSACAYDFIIHLIAIISMFFFSFFIFCWGMGVGGEGHPAENESVADKDS